MARHQHHAADSGRRRRAAGFGHALDGESRRPRLRSARRSSSAVEGISGSSRSRSGNRSPAAQDRRARRYLSSGATRAMATARSASLATPSPLTSLVDTTAWRCPTSTRKPDIVAFRALGFLDRAVAHLDALAKPRAPQPHRRRPRRRAWRPRRGAAPTCSARIDRTDRRRPRTKAATLAMVKRSRTNFPGLNLNGSATTRSGRHMKCA